MAAGFSSSFSDSGHPRSGHPRYRAVQIPGLPAASPRGLHPDGPEADHALTFNLGRSVEAVHIDTFGGEGAVIDLDVVSRPNRVVDCGVRTGDVVLFSGSSKIHQFVQRKTASIWSQVGLLIEREDNRLLILECTSDSVCADIETGEAKAGVRTVQFAERFERFQGRVAVRKILPALSKQQVNEVWLFRQSILGMPFDFGRLSGRKTLKRTHTEWDAKSFSCAGLVAWAYQSIGVLRVPPDGPLPSNVHPADFADENLELLNGFRFSTLEEVG